MAEAAQEVFIRMLKALPDFEVNETPFRFWLFRIARNYAIEHEVPVIYECHSD